MCTCLSRNEAHFLNSSSHLQHVCHFLSLSSLSRCHSLTCTEPVHRRIAKATSPPHSPTSIAAMVKRKAFLPLEEKLAKPWCYYCGKEWVDNKVLLSHMRDVHLKCDSCYRRLNTAGGLKVHKEQVHKEQLHRIENALPGRESIDIEVFVMEGIPEELVQARRKAIAEEHYREQNEYVQRTGNLPPGSTEPNPHLKKKPKLESTEDLKARVAALKKKKEAEKAAKANGGNVGVNTEYGSDNASPSPAPVSAPSFISLPAYLLTLCDFRQRRPVFRIKVTPLDRCRRSLRRSFRHKQCLCMMLHHTLPTRLRMAIHQILVRPCMGHRRTRHLNSTQVMLCSGRQHTRWLHLPRLKLCMHHLHTHQLRQSTKDLHQLQ